LLERTHPVAFLLLDELDDGPPFGFFEQFGRWPPLSDVIFGRRLWVISTYLGAQSQYTFFEQPKNFLD